MTEKRGHYEGRDYSKEPYHGATIVGGPNAFGHHIIYGATRADGMRPEGGVAENEVHTFPDGSKGPAHPEAFTANKDPSYE